MDVKQIISTETFANSEDITIILSVHSRPEYFERLIQTIDEVKYHSIWISCWYSKNYEIFYKKYKDLKKITKNKLYFFSSNYQLKYFGRFQLAYQVSTKYTLILDDDCIIQSKFYELCIKMINIPDYNGLLGIKGWIFPEKDFSNLLGSYGGGTFYYPKPEWKKEEQTEKAFEIDIVGGTWFFRTEWILYLFKEFPHTFETGEDFHFSYMLRKYGNIKTYFIPNDNNYKEYWGCSDDFSTIDMSGNSRNSNMGELRKKIFWKQYLGLCPFVNRKLKKIDNLLIICNEDDYYLSRLIKNREQYLILVLSENDINIHENNFYLSDLNKFENFNLIKKFTEKYPQKLNCSILNGFLQNNNCDLKSYLAILGRMFDNLFEFDNINVFNYNEIVKNFNINNKKINIYDRRSINDLTLYSNVNSDKKFFKGEITYFNFLLKNNINFSVIRFNDGEYNILKDNNQEKNQDGWNLDINIRQKPLYLKFKNLFNNIKNNSYFFIGIMCPCCMKEDTITYTKKYIGENFTNYTWGNIFVNANYNYFMDNIYEKTLQQKEIVLICNEKSNINNLKLNIIKVFYINNEWYNADDLLCDILEYGKNVSDKVFLFASGPFSKIAITELYNINCNNTYLDIGSVFNKILLGLDNRGYLKGSYTLNKCCRW